MPTRSTTHQVLRLVEHVTKGFNSYLSTLAVFLNVHKAYDSTWHTGLFYKLRSGPSLLLFRRLFVLSSTVVLFRSTRMVVFPQSVRFKLGFRRARCFPPFCTLSSRRTFIGHFRLSWPSTRTTLRSSPVVGISAISMGKSNVTLMTFFLGRPVGVSPSVLLKPMRFFFPSAIFSVTSRCCLSGVRLSSIPLL